MGATSWRSGGKLRGGSTVGAWGCPGRAGTDHTVTPAPRGQRPPGCPAALSPHAVLGAAAMPGGVQGTESPAGQPWAGVPGCGGSREGVLGPVGALVELQGALLAEALPTLGAGVGPLPAVGSLVLDEVRSLPEALPAVGAAEGFLPSVDPPMLDEVGAQPEALPAVPADRQSRHSRISLLDEIRQPPEALPTCHHSALPLPQGCSLNPF